jgi:hypothetical protein
MRNESAGIQSEQEVSVETRLWQAVIASAVQDWVSGPLRRQREAEQYLFHDESDFRLVCDSAGMDGGRLRAKLSKLRRHAPVRIELTSAA